jgi:prepilin peptidase CpaA
MEVVFTLAAVGLFAAAAVTDGRSRRIPNLLPAGLALLGLMRIVAALAAGTGIGPAAADLAAAAAVFAAGALAFRFGLFGGGDAKLLAAGALWLGTAALGAFLLTTVLAGGALALVFLLAGLLGRRGLAGTATASLPYGIAIAAGGILTSAGALWT